MDFETKFALTKLVIGIIWVIVIIGIIITLKHLGKQATEKKLYKLMISNPCDATVIKYIAAFNATYGRFSSMLHANAAVAHRNDLIRQGQGWEIIRTSTTVSKEAKEKLRNAFIAQGVPVKNQTIEA